MLAKEHEAGALRQRKRPRAHLVQPADFLGEAKERDFSKVQVAEGRPPGYRALSPPTLLPAMMQAVYKTEPRPETGDQRPGDEEAAGSCLPQSPSWG